MRIQFYPYSSEKDPFLKFAVIGAVYHGKWVFCRHAGRNVWEMPGGHREPGESIEQVARRELWEETGAQKFELVPVTVYGVRETASIPETETLGMLYAARISVLGPLPPLEIEEISIQKDFPVSWTYPEIQPVLWERLELALPEWFSRERTFFHAAERENG